jgi:metal-responsive CopG/Arc/MetJ family transcriptional regulator
MGRTTKVVGFSVPPALATELERIALEEHRTKSELFREMLRIYQKYRQQRERESDDWIAALIRDAQDEQARHPMTVEDMVREDTELAAYGAAQTAKLGHKYHEVDRLIHDFRARQRP